MNILGLIPARGGSKGVPRKNIRLLAGKPLLAYTAEAALASNRLSRIILSTDDEEIAAVGRTCGLAVPFLRPAELALDTTPTLPVIQHAVQFLEAQGERFDAICLLQPTNPLRQTSDIDGCIELLESAEADTVFTMLAVPAEHNPHWVYFRTADGSLRLSTGEAAPIPRRQDLPPAFHREGSVYVARRDVVMLENSLYGARVIGFEIERSRSVNIDNLEDWTKAELLIQEKAPSKDNKMAQNARMRLEPNS
ncbi:MAG TPA: acylneuraminate cytidylyltransferase family protein [Blastocatellia bacterium]|nr:acylneuraminate cytidylyltransferase family protein [Blastocatellia bacterium]